MICKWIGGLLLLLAGGTMAFGSVKREREHLSVTDAFYALVVFAAQQIAEHGATVPEMLARAGHLTAACRVATPDAAAVLAAAERELPRDVAEAVKDVFDRTAGTREEQTDRCRAAVRILGEYRQRQSEALPGNTRVGTILPLSAVAAILLLFW